MTDETFFEKLFAPRAIRPVAKKRKRRRTEARIQKQLVQWLVQRDVLVAVTDAGWAYGIPSGWPDLTCCLPNGRFMGVECKAPNGRQSEAQKQTQQAVEDRGAIYILAASLDDLIARLRQEEKFSYRKTGMNLD